MNKLCFSGLPYLDESKVLQYFCNVRYNSVAPYAFAEVIKVTQNTKLWDTKLAWYSPNVTCWIWLIGLEHALGISALKLLDLAWLMRFLQPEWYFFKQFYLVLWHVNHSRLFNAKFLLILIIIVISRREHGFPWFSSSIRLYRSLHSASPLDYITCLYRAVVDRF